MSEQRKRGRPSIKTDEICAAICDRISEGRSLRDVCNDDDMPSFVTVFKWMQDDEEFAKQYVRATDVRAEYEFEEMEHIAKTEEDVHRARLIIDTRKWKLARMRPKKYGDRLELDAKVEHAVDPSKAAETIEMIVGKLGI